MEKGSLESQISLIKSKMEEIHNDFEHNVVGLKVPRELIYSVDLCYHSVDSFYFQNRKVEKGMIELLIVGDTRTGKSHTVKAMAQHFQRGDFIQGEACSLAGLLGGVDEGGNGNRFVKCGRLPLFHKQLVTIDEANELHEEIVGKMSGVRSSGTFDIVKIVTGRIQCKIRLIWIANPRSGRKVGEYSFGVETVPEVIGKPEDIARFDCALIVGRKSINKDSLYLAHNDKQKVTHKYTSAVCRDLVMWSWSRTAEQVVIDDETEREILESAKYFSMNYDETIPLVVETEIRIKIARLAISLAARLYSTDDGERLIVKPAHVVVISDWLAELYSGEAVGYLQYSNARKSGALGDEVQIVCDALGRKGMMALLNMKVINKSILRDIFRDTEAGDICFSKLLLGRAIRNQGRGFRMTESFIDKLKTEADRSELVEPNGRRLPGIGDKGFNGTLPI